MKIESWLFGITTIFLILVTLFFFKRETDRAAVPPLLAPEGAA